MISENKNNDGGPAFPLLTPMFPLFTQYSAEKGMTLRDYFAGQILAGYSALDDNRTLPAGRDVTEWRSEMRAFDAKWIYEMADAMIAQRNAS